MLKIINIKKRPIFSSNDFLSSFFIHCVPLSQIENLVSEKTAFRNNKTYLNKLNVVKIIRSNTIIKPPLPAEVVQMPASQMHVWGGGPLSDTYK